MQTLATSTYLEASLRAPVLYTILHRMDLTSEFKPFAAHLALPSEVSDPQRPDPYLASQQNWEWMGSRVGLV